jgi:hypothetical protein
MSKMGIKDLYPSGERIALLQSFDFVYWPGKTEDGKDEGERRE